MGTEGMQARVQAPFKRPEVTKENNYVVFGGELKVKRGFVKDGQCLSIFTG